MSTSNIIELLSLIATLLAAAGVGVSKLTRIAVGLETVGKGFEAVGKLLEQVTSQVSTHETAIAILKDHDQVQALTTQAKVSVNGSQPTP